MGSVMSPATVAVMSAVPEAKAGVGSAMNDVNRQVAGALGVAVIGSISSSIYSSKLEVATAALPKAAASTATDSVGGAVAVHLPGQASDALTAAAQRVHRLDGTGAAGRVGGRADRRDARQALLA